MEGVIALLLPVLIVSIICAYKLVSKYLDRIQPRPVMPGHSYAQDLDPKSIETLNELAENLNRRLENLEEIYTGKREVK